MIRSLFIFLALFGVGAGGVAWYYYEQGEQPNSFRTVPVERGDMLATISSTATIEPEEVVDVGAQVQGMIKTFGKDPRDKTNSIDYGTPVEEGTVLAQIDDSIYKTQVDMAKATLENNIALLAEAKTKLSLSNQNWDRAQALRKNNVMTQADYDSAKADLQTQAPAVDAAQAAVDQAKASLAQAQTNLRYTTITSPVKGVIIDRRVNIGQTVVASLSAPSLFLIAKDLKRLQLWASVNEADIGQIHPGQTARFTVDAFSGRTFRGTVAQIRLNAVMTQNVVTYTVVITTDNSSGKLLPYLTANVQFEVAHHENTLLIPTTAIRWKPQPNQIVPDAREAYSKASRRREGGGGGGGGGKSGGKHESGSESDQEAKNADAKNGDATSPDTTNPDAKGPDAKKGTGDDAKSMVDSKRADGKSGARRHGGGRKRDMPTVWVEEDGFARPIQVQTGLTDGTQVEVVSGDLKEGTRVIIGEQRHDEGSQATKNPFLPTFFRGNANKKKSD
jgi:HlyD family secretion protein